MDTAQKRRYKKFKETYDSKEPDRPHLHLPEHGEEGLERVTQMAKHADQQGGSGHGLVDRVLTPLFTEPIERVSSLKESADWFEKAARRWIAVSQASKAAKSYNAAVKMLDKYLGSFGIVEQYNADLKDELGGFASSWGPAYSSVEELRKRKKELTKHKKILEKKARGYSRNICFAA